jgi:hypothetical protein
MFSVDTTYPGLTRRNFVFRPDVGLIVRFKSDVTRHFRPIDGVCAMSASLIGRLGANAFTFRHTETSFDFKGSTKAERRAQIGANGLAK